MSPPSDNHVINLRGTHHPSFHLSFSNLTYTVKTSSSTTKTILSSISGQTCDGEILSIMGASGSGKTTLIDTLAQRISSSRLKGTITLNGHAINHKLLRSISAYVMQDDLMYPMLTVHETLTFAAEFRLPGTLSQSKKKARVEALIDQLGLRMAAHTIIGDEGHRGVSGGERRRVSIGTDIIHDPIILFLDEPTSGLDSTSAYMVVSVLKRIAAGGSIVITAVHQPSSRIVGLFDRILLLSEGRSAYLGSPDRLSSYFSEFGRPIPDNENRTEFALDLFQELESTKSMDELVKFNESWQRATKNATDHEFYYSASGGVSLREAIEASVAGGRLVSGGGKFANSWWTEMGVLMRRSFTNAKRIPELFAVRTAAVLLTGFILATMFRRLDDSPKGARERLAFIGFTMCMIHFSCGEALPVFLQDK